MKPETKIKILKIPVIGSVFLFLFRGSVAFGYLRQPAYKLLRWLFTSRELTNFTYDITDRNKQYLASTISLVTRVPREEILGYFQELIDNEHLSQHIETQTKAAEFSFMADRQARYGRRMGWYALVRATKPKVIIETGVDKGLGSCVLTAALLQNQKEGHEGRYFGTDINPKAGYLLSGDYSAIGEILYGDSIESLNQFDQPIDLFINDSDHSAEYEGREYDVIHPMLSENGLILGDNAHVTSKLVEFSNRTNRDFIYFQEEPKDHWYPGAGIGISFRKS